MYIICIYFSAMIMITEDMYAIMYILLTLIILVALWLFFITDEIFKDNGKNI